MPKILVTGGAGFIGSNLVETLVEQGEDVTVLDNLSTGTKNNLQKVIDEVDLIEKPCSEIPNLDIEKPDKIFHIGIPSSSPMYRENPLLVGSAINEFIKIMEFAKENDSKVVYASSSSMYGKCEPPHSEDMEIEAFDYYTEARLAMERLAKVYHDLHDVNSVGLRFFSVYGPHEKAKGKYANVLSQFYWRMKEDKRPVIYGDGTQTRDLTHVGDVVQALLKASEKDLGYDMINVGTGKETSFNDIVGILNKKLNKTIEPKYVENPIENYVSRTLADLTKAKKLLDYEPKVELEEGIEKIIKNN
ncbi:nucleoside-diphosphate sugar epimerase [candidate division MSBL1 archaeon SCGC-AAA382A13]|uniref:Nucleoside-diphosphate sugar epimerase n=1 Tax=candidate division MSBL1 archaeon SCGC-AAA382A13 TaxID=1698279 RepID=A0A133VGF5_9EURY|nr:nucleoside-diphosphate sugar epimerase [candidate division MSBL1 archaeon SCGC-AAA382A13]